MTNKAKRKTTKPAETVRSVTKSAVLRSGSLSSFSRHPLKNVSPGLLLPLFHMELKFFADL